MFGSNRRSSSSRRRLQLESLETRACFDASLPHFAVVAPVPVVVQLPPGPCTPAAVVSSPIAGATSQSLGAAQPHAGGVQMYAMFAY
ncbi:MAG TPA: hypothetical protein PLV92_13390 [Pirellulaceae bacterium]|nr:hypothetical protein [Pirellulaceae bacterium]